MEDEDVEGQVTDAWAVRADNQSPQIEESLKRTSRVLSESAVSPKQGYNDVGIEENKEDRCSSDGSEDSPGKNAIDGSTSKIVFKGFKKRILAQAQENQIGARGNSHENFHPSGRPPREKRTSEGKRGKITEYAQYLGLQPAPTNNKSKCSRCCVPSTNTCAQSMLKPHQCTCYPGSTAGRSSPGTSESPPSTAANPPPSSAPSAANNFRITRKVYLCAACGTYFENWNLFLHMREIHKRHICLFCLGMFGQAERLSYHLAKKHSVPETSFTSVEDFYNVFKGSCYLICCTCEKVFSETDNFYNHFCSPVQKGRASAAASETVCSLCRQTGGHSASCSLAETRDPSQNSSGIPGIPGIPGKDGHPPRNKRTLKNNRLKRSEESLLTSYQQKLSEMYARKMSMKSREASASASSGDEAAAALSITSESLETATTTTATVATTMSLTTTTTTTTTTDNETARSSRDTVSETIMEVSKCTDDSRGNKTFPEAAEEIVEVNSKSDSTKIESSPCPSPSMSPSRSPSPLRRQSDASMYDSVAETIMEVSRCSNDSHENTSAEEEDVEDEETSRNDARRESRDTGSDTDVLVMDEVADLDNDAESANGKEDYDDRLKAPTTNERRKTTTAETQEDETIEVTDSDDECSSNQSAAASPARLNSTGDTGSSPEKESQTTSSVSFTTVNATDRSLVIKICTNRNSQFSVTSANGGNYNENHDTSRESEENNNAEDSASEKHSNHSGANSLRNEDEEDEQSDTDSGKLAVVDEEKPAAASGEPGQVEIEMKGQPEDGEKLGEKIDAGEKLENDENAEKSQSMEAKNSEEAADVVAEEKKPEEPSDGIILAAEDVPSIDVNVEGLLESMEIEDLLKRCISAASGCCVYCNHARHIAVNGKQLSLHVLAEHRFQPQHPAIIIQREQFTARVKKSIDDVDSRYFNLCSFDNSRGTYEIQNPRVFECFHCRFHSLVHKDIYLHNRKMHQKTILICIMCKSTFYSYSELLCHLCPGVYAPNVSITYRCCLCTVSNLPSAFRLMVHLRKRHHSCDVCLESTGNQQRLSNHVWKHKLHHLCYRCGIAYRNKPDITKHLFWKHGTESVLCKKCLQKKWPHVYHFCIPPTAFVCEECTSSFSRAVALKVHKRLHSGDRPYGCEECTERFISKKLLAKHEASHREPEKPVEVAVREKTPEKEAEATKNSIEAVSQTAKATETDAAETATTEAAAKPKEVVKKVVDVYDLPPLNLSSESDSDSDDQAPPESAAKAAKETEEKKEETKPEETQETSTEPAAKASNVDVDVADAIVDPELNEEVKKEEAQIMDGIWDNFKSYAASLEKSSLVEATIDEKKEEEARLKFLCEVILADHDYCVVSSDKSATEEQLKEDSKTEDNCGTMEGEHDYGYKQSKSPSAGSAIFNCDSDTNAKKKKEKSPKKRKQNGSTSSSDSSSDSDSSSCSCGTNCSCSSSSSGSSSSSSSSSDSDSSASEGSPKKSSARKERKKEKEVAAAAAAAANEAKIEVDDTADVSAAAAAAPAEAPTTREEPTHPNDEGNQSIEICEPPRSPQLVLRESDLDTDETETDEDFYDEHPQQLANKLLAEKRNQLMLLAAVAPASTESAAAAAAAAAAGATPVANNINNGALDAETPNANSVATNVDGEARNSNARGQTRKRVKTKKRKKADRAKTNRVSTPTVESIKLNIPKSFYQKKQPGYGAPAIITVLPSRSSTPSLQNCQPDVAAPFTPDQGPNKANVRLSVGGSGSENENKRSSKRKRVPKRFYGDSSDEEAERQQQLQQQQQQLQQQQQQPQPQPHYTQPSLKWRKVENTPPFVPSLSIKTQPQPSVNYPTKNVTIRLSGFDQPMERIVPMNAAAVASESEEPADSSSAESSEAEENVGQPVQQPIQQPPQPPPPPPQPQQQPHQQPPIGVPNPAGILAANSTGERNVNLYCYCQCPYDEVSEMIACDGDDCRIEWFHFECVGIMVPPKGKWYCPDCRKKDGSLPSNDDYFD